jgi:hypothetical protein
MNCDEARARYLDGSDGAAVEGHFAACSACRIEQSALDEVKVMLADAGMWEEPPADLGDVIAGMIAGPARASRRPGGRRFAAIGAIAAAVLIAVSALMMLRPERADWEVAIPPIQASESATATLAGWNREGGTELLLEVDGIDPAPAGYYYELWFSKGRRHVSAGTFTAAGSVDLWVGVARADYPRLWITLEPIDDDEGPSSVVLFDDV